MIHFLYVGHFERVDNCMNQEKLPDGRPWPVITRRLDMDLVQKILDEFAIEDKSTAEEWHTELAEHGFLVWSAHANERTRSFISRIANATNCDIFYDGLYLLSPDDL